MKPESRRASALILVLKRSRRGLAVGRAMQPLRQQVQIAVAAAERFQRLNRRQNIVPIIAGASVTVPNQMNLRIERQPAGILRMTAVVA